MRTPTKPTAWAAAATCRRGGFCRVSPAELLAKSTSIVTTPLVVTKRMQNYGKW